FTSSTGPVTWYVFPPAAKAALLSARLAAANKLSAVFVFICVRLDCFDLALFKIFARQAYRHLQAMQSANVQLCYSFGGAGIARTPTRAKYSSAWSRSFPARSTILSRLSIDEPSSSCSVRNQWRELIVM